MHNNIANINNYENTMEKESLFPKSYQRELSQKKQRRVYLISFLIFIIALVYLIIKTSHLSSNLINASQEIRSLKEKVITLSESNNNINHRFEQAIIQLDLKGIASKYQSDLLHSIDEIDILRKLIRKTESTKITFDIFYKATIDGDDGYSFRRILKGNSIILIIIELSNGNRIAIYQRRKLDGSGSKKDPRAFIYSFEQKTKYMIEEHSDIAIRDFNNHFPIYGDNLIHLNDNCLSMATSYSQFLALKNLFPEDYYSSTYKSQNRTYFEISEIETFNVSFT